MTEISTEKKKHLKKIMKYKFDTSKRLLSAVRTISIFIAVNFVCECIQVDKPISTNMLYAVQFANACSDQY